MKSSLKKPHTKQKRDRHNHPRKSIRMRHYFVQVLQWEPTPILIDGEEISLMIQMGLFTHEEGWRLPTVGEFNAAYDSSSRFFPRGRYWATDEKGRIVVITMGMFVTSSKKYRGKAFRRMVRFAFEGIRSTSEGGQLAGVDFDFR